MRNIDILKIADRHFQVDMRGWVCPFPKYALEPLLSKLDTGDTIDLLVDCPSATEDVPKTAASLGCQTRLVEPIGGGEWRIQLNK
jgi:tRNA 2-thiouridine synthesizing protein A